MHMILRILLLLAGSRRRSKLSMLEAGSVRMRATLTDIDFAGHINNGMYFSIFDLGRFDLMFRSGFWQVMRANKWTPVVQAETITFRKSVKLGQRFTQETKLLGADTKCIYFEQRIVVDGQIYAKAIIATRIISAKGPVSNEQIMAAAGEALPGDEQLPQWISQWREASALPGSRKPAPHRWLA